MGWMQDKSKVGYFSLHRSRDIRLSAIKDTPRSVSDLGLGDLCVKVVVSVWDSSLGLVACLSASPLSWSSSFPFNVRLRWRREPIFGPGFSGPSGYKQSCDVFSHTRQLGNFRSLGVVSAVFSSAMESRWIHSTISPYGCDMIDKK